MNIPGNRLGDLLRGFDMTELKSVLILGAGGGFDVVSIQMIRSEIIREFPDTQVDTAGMLNPKFDHFFSIDDESVPTFEGPVNVGPHVVRYRRTTNESGVRSYSWYREFGESKWMVDKPLQESVDWPIYLFSTRFGYDELSEFVRNYSAFFVCDIGGDILYAGSSCNEAITPLIDGFSLGLASRVSDAGDVLTGVLVFGLGTDGELYPENIEACLETLDAMGGILDVGVLDTRCVGELERFYKMVSVNTSGKTIRLILETWNAIKNGRPLPQLAGRDMRMYRRWANRIYALETEAVCRLNPLTAGDSFDAIRKIGESHGWVQTDRSRNSEGSTAN